MLTEALIRRRVGTLEDWQAAEIIKTGAGEQELRSGLVDRSPGRHHGRTRQGPVSDGPGHRRHPGRGRAARPGRVLTRPVAGTVRIGLSGWNDPNWKNGFYKGVPRRMMRAVYTTW